MNKFIIAAAVAAFFVSGAAVASDDEHSNSSPSTVVPTNNTSTSRSVSRNNNSNQNRNVNRNTNQQQQSQNANSSANSNSNANASNVFNDRQRLTVASVIPSSLTSGMDTCLGSASAGLQTQIVGLSGGKTTVDANCVLIKQTQLLIQMGYPVAACYRARLGTDGAAIDEAMKLAGIECREPPAVTTPVEQPTQQSLFK
jgi:hypothetical protein